MDPGISRDFSDHLNINVDDCVKPHPHATKDALICSIEQYNKMYQESIHDTKGFWDRIARKELNWFHPYENVCNVDLDSSKFNIIPPDGNVVWFQGGRINACYNAVDRHVYRGRGDKVAILHEGNKPGDATRITYRELLERVSKLANGLLSIGVRKGDVVTIYMSMVPEAAYCKLACARIGAIASVVFAGFSSEALVARIQDGKSTHILTASEAFRGEKVMALKSIVDVAIRSCPTVRHVVVLNTSNEPSNFQVDEALSHPVMFYDYRNLVDAQRPYCPCEWMDSEDPLFILYTSGSTGKPKGMVHTTAGYLVYAAVTHRYIFDVHEDDIYACVADIGWITGHTYIVWGPLLNGATTVMFESLPTYPSPDRYWDLVERYKINLFYTAPTAIRLLMKFGEEPVRKHDLSSLRVLGSVGEPVNPSAWKWYHKVVGKERCSVVDTYWMTESGGIVMTPLPGVTIMKPGSCCRPFFGIQPALVDPKTGDRLEGGSVRGVMCITRPWPGMARTIKGDHKRFIETYLSPYPGYFFTGDGAFRDDSDYYWVIGRVDDVINVSGHRLGTAELESALVSHFACSEVAVVGVPHEVKGQAIHAFCILKHGFEATPGLPGEFSNSVRRQIGGIAIPEKIYIVPGLPKTRSGKIMRRILRKIASNDVESLGDISTLAEPHIVKDIIDVVQRTN